MVNKKLDSLRDEARTIEKIKELYLLSEIPGQNREIFDNIVAFTVHSMREAHAPLVEFAKDNCACYKMPNISGKVIKCDACNALIDVGYLDES